MARGASSSPYACFVELLILIAYQSITFATEQLLSQLLTERCLMGNQVYLRRPLWAMMGYLNDDIFIPTIPFPFLGTYLHKHDHTAKLIEYDFRL